MISATSCHSFISSIFFIGCSNVVALNWFLLYRPDSVSTTLAVVTTNWSETRVPVKKRGGLPSSIVLFIATNQGYLFVRGLLNLNIDRYCTAVKFQERGPKAPSCSEKGQEISNPPTPHQLSHSLFGVGFMCIRIYRSIDVKKEEPYLFTFSLVTTSALL